jgi:hypothetical protein
MTGPILSPGNKIGPYTQLSQVAHIPVGKVTQQISEYLI